jgi:hypothetical protein
VPEDVIIHLLVIARSAGPGRPAIEEILTTPPTPRQAAIDFFDVQERESTTTGRLLRIDTTTLQVQEIPLPRVVIQ